MERSPSWENYRLSANQEIPQINPVAQYHIQKSPPPVPFLNLSNPGHGPDHIS